MVEAGWAGPGAGRAGGPSPAPGGAAPTVVVLPGSGSDDVFVRRAFGPVARALGWRLVSPAPAAGRGVVSGYRSALDAAAAARRAAAPLLVGGISLGAHVAARWAAERGPDGPDGLLLALPAWTGAPVGPPPAAAAARATAAVARRAGVAGAIAAARGGAPRWLADELARAWTGYGDGLADALEEAAAEPGPAPAALRGLAVPVGLAALPDDPVHPLAVADEWRGLLPRAALCTTTLAAVGADPGALGRAAALAWLRARHPAPAPERGRSRP